MGGNGAKMAIHPLVVRAAREGWRWQWLRLMAGLGPADRNGHYRRPNSTPIETIVLEGQDLEKRNHERKPHLIVGRSCPWAHRVWLVFQLRGLSSSINLLVADANHNEGRWRLEPTWLDCKNLLELYKLCAAPPSYRATVPVLVDPGATRSDQPRLLGNDSTPLSAALCLWPAATTAINLAPTELQPAIETWQELIQPSINDGVYRCGFARTQRAFDDASQALFSALDQVEGSLQTRGPWLCGEQLTLADIRLFPTMIRWETVYSSLFGCSAKPLWMFPALWEWRQKVFALPGVSESCDSQGWKQDYFGALFPLNPSGIVPDGPDLGRLIGATPAPNK